MIIDNKIENIYNNNRITIIDNRITEMKNSLTNIRKRKDLIKLVENEGYYYDHTTGSHDIYKGNNKPPLSIPKGKDVSRGTLRNVIKLIEGDNYYQK